MNRPAWVEMIGRILADGVRTVVIEKLDRLARDLMVQEHIIRDLQERGITLISAAEPDLCSNDPTRKLLR
jgi:DNA invertase Pin-like site-specific DNA recombinase